MDDRKLLKYSADNFCDYSYRYLLKEQIEAIWIWEP